MLKFVFPLSCKYSANYRVIASLMAPPSFVLYISVMLYVLCVVYVYVLRVVYPFVLYVYILRGRIYTFHNSNPAHVS